VVWLAVGCTHAGSLPGHNHSGREREPER
jgi:hypothetical protein